MKNLLFFIILNCDVIPNNLTLIPTYDSSMLYIQVLLSKIKFYIKKYIIIPIYAKKKKEKKGIGKYLRTHFDENTWVKKWITKLDYSSD